MKRPAGKSMKKKPKKPDAVEVPRPFRPVAAAFSGSRGVSLEKGWGSGSAVLKFKGKIFAMLVRGNFVAKLPKTRVDELVSSGAGYRFDPRGDGRVMKEWIVVRAGRGASWVGLAREASRFVKRA